ncbi:MAG: phosphoenolpyruvate synthase, partial [Syntrophomonadaceae bacterium]|nr:phosphoenolpyruvate synthase [Syntrophomonadaceae bacterium]
SAVLVEIAQEETGFMPELSFGTHFFQDLVETRIFYVALFPGQERVEFKRDYFDSAANRFTTYLPDYEKWQKVIQVVDVSDTGKELWVESDLKSQETYCYFHPCQE